MRGLALGVARGLPCPVMLGFIRRLLRGPSVTVPETDRIPEGEARKVAIGDPLAGGLELVLCRVEGRLHALDTVCPHEGGRIVPGPLIDGRYALCPLHNYKFDPRTGAEARALCRAARTFRVKEAHGSAEIWGAR